MTLYAVIFYVLGFVIVAATGFAIFQRNLIHAVVYLVVSFLASALLFYLLGAPFLAALQVIVYSGAIMVLFLFIIMMIKTEIPLKKGKHLFQWIPAFVLGGVSLGVFAILILAGPEAGVPLKTAVASPMELGRHLFHNYWFAIEIVSFLLFVALVGALFLGRNDGADDNRSGGVR